jgi:hypothetical protein
MSGDDFHNPEFDEWKRQYMLAMEKHSIEETARTIKDGKEIEKILLSRYVDSTTEWDYDYCGSYTNAEWNE